MNGMDNLILLAEDNSTDVLMIRRAFSKTNLQGTLEVADDGDKS
jgi:hypothetical protein